MAWTFEVNTYGPLRVTQALLPNLQAGEKKTVVQISSVMGSIAQNRGGYYSYRASKTALNQLNKSLSIELGRQGFTCVALHPGWVQTDMGGPQAKLTIDESVNGLADVLEGASGAGFRFVDYKGDELAF